MASDLKGRPRQHQRGQHYGLELDRALRVIAESCNYFCAERLCRSGDNPGHLACALQRFNTRVGEHCLHAPGGSVFDEQVGLFYIDTDTLLACHPPDLPFTQPLC
jgi:hypothetical protein